LHDSFL